MKILHIYPEHDNMIASYVNILVEGMRNSAEVKASCNPHEYRDMLQSIKPDIVHCHGCWQYAIVRATDKARRQGARIVLTPHGQLEPWLLNERYLKEKLFKSLLWQHRSVEQAYALIALGKMEQKHLAELGWNKRIEVISNSVITNTITPQQMCSRMFAVYQKVMDSDVLAQMDSTTRAQLAAIIKAGITGDSRWVDRTPFDASPTDWRRLMIYAEQEGIKATTDYGITILGLNAPIIDTSKISSYLPDSYRPPTPIKDTIGEYKGDETAYVVRMIKQISRKPLMLHLVELARELRRDSINDAALQAAFEEENLTKFAQRLMTVLAETTQLEEGYMPITAIDDRQTERLRNMINNHLKI